MQRAKKHNVAIKDQEPDAEILKWEEWIQIRKEETTHLGLRLDKPPIDLAMNLLVNKREDKEWKVALEHAQILKNVDEGDRPWEKLITLPQHCRCDPEYEVQRTAAELGKPQIIEHICVPKLIQKTDLGMTGKSKRLQAQVLNKEFKNYRRKREEELKEQIKKIDPHKPNCSNLVIKGRIPETPPIKWWLPLPTITITEASEIDDICTVYAVRINNTVIYKDNKNHTHSNLEKIKEEKLHEGCKTWTYYFNTPVNKAGRCKLFLQNLGTVTLRYCWKKIKKTIPLIPEDIYEQVFFYNKNEDVISPGQEKTIFFTFLSSKPGIYSEFWELSFCNICFFDSLSEKLSINLYADSVEKIGNVIRKSEILKMRIQRRVAINIVSDILDHVLIIATAVKPQIYPYRHYFVEAEMFVLKNPVCFYHQTEVNEMKKIYNQMVPKEQWDLSIATWRKAMMAKPYEERIKYYDMLKKSHRDFLRPWYEGNDLLQQKYRIVKTILNHMIVQFEIEYEKLSDLYNDYGICESPKTHSTNVVDPGTKQTIQNIFYLRAYELLGTTVERCAGILGSLELNRWIEFNFCQ